MRLYLAIAGILGLLTVGGGGVYWIMDTRATNAALEASVASLTREAAVATQKAEQAALARDVERATVKRLQADADEFQAIREWSLSNDAEIPIPDSLRPVLDKLFNRPPR